MASLIAFAVAIDIMYYMIACVNATLYRRTSKLNLTGQDLSRVFNSRYGCDGVCHATVIQIKTAKLKVVNSAQTTFWLSPQSFSSPQ